MSETPTRVLVADDHAPTRDTVRRALEADGCVVVAEAATAQNAVRGTEQHDPDVVLLDIHMPGSGIQAAREISQLRPATAVVMLTQSDEDEDLFDSLRAGACGYLKKGADPALLGQALRAVLAGEAVLPGTLVMKVLDEFRAPARRRFGRGSKAAARLSTREWEVMELLGSGLSTDAVAARLFLSPTTVRVHVSTVLKKLRVTDRESAFRLLRED